MESREKPEISPFDSVDPAPPSQESNITNLSNTHYLMKMRKCSKE